jgi:hypothetical protein
MDKTRARKGGPPNERPERPRPEAKRKNARSGERAESALANLREIERTRSQCEPAEDVLPLAPAHPAATTAPAA